MPGLNLAPTKSNLLSLKRQLAFAQEGYDLLEQKRQILIFELTSRLTLARQLEQDVANLLKRAYAALREATLEIGSENLDRAVFGVKQKPELALSFQRLMGMRIPKITATTPPIEAPFGVGGTSGNTDLARLRFVELLPKLEQLGELQNAVMRLARELRKTQRRCNALSKTFIPRYQQTINYIAATLEERERESLVVMKMVRARLDNRSAAVP